MANSVRSKLFVDGRDLSGDAQSIAFPRSTDVQETSGLDDTSKQFAATVKDGGQIAVELLWNNAANKSQYLGGQVANIKQIIYGPNLDTAGEEAVVVNDSIFNAHDRAHGRGELVGVSATFQLSQDVNEGVFLQGSTAITTTGAQTGLDGGAASSDGITCWLQILDITDMASLDVKVEMDTAGGFASPTTVVTFTQVADASEPAVEEKTAAGSVERHLRVNVTFNTPGGSPSATIVVAVKRG